MSLILKRASAIHPSRECSEDDFDVIADGVVVGRIKKAAAVPLGQSWIWTLAVGYHKGRTPTHGYESTREAAMAAAFRRADGDVNRPAVGSIQRFGES